MGKKIKVVLNRAGVRELLRSQEMLDGCIQLAADAQARLGEGYEVNSRVGKNRVNAEIAAVTDQARRENLKNNTILKALGSAGEG